MIHPTAIVSDQANIGEGVTIGPFCVVEDRVKIGPRTVLRSHVVVRKGSVIGADCLIDSFSITGGDPNFLEFDPTVSSGVVIGDQSTLREGVTIHRSIHEGGNTRIGSKVFLMAGFHAGHDCLLEDGVVAASDALLGGHVTVGRNAFLGGNSSVHQHSRIGEGSMIGGTARITKDVAPFLLISERDDVSGLNLIGLRRRKVPTETIRELKELYHLILRSPGNPVSTVKTIEKPKSPEAIRFCEFFVPSSRSYAKGSIARS
ncbi:MAG: acyl-ACP--UDP-N-acetylglucosamine O-acyltransferase [Verrucomicrobiota bacterium]